MASLWVALEAEEAGFLVFNHLYKVLKRCLAIVLGEMICVDRSESLVVTGTGGIAARLGVTERQEVPILNSVRF